MVIQPKFTFASFLLRYLISLILVFVTYNPSEYCWVQWLYSDTVMVYKVASGIVLLIGWVIVSARDLELAGCIRHTPGRCFFRGYDLAVNRMGTASAR